MPATATRAAPTAATMRAGGAGVKKSVDEFYFILVSSQATGWIIRLRSRQYHEMEFAAAGRSMSEGRRCYQARERPVLLRKRCLMHRPDFHIGKKTVLRRPENCSLAAAGRHPVTMRGTSDHESTISSGKSCSAESLQLAIRWRKCSVGSKMQHDAYRGALSGCENILMQSIHKSLHSLDQKLRRSVLATRFTQAQRLAFERWMLSRPLLYKAKDSPIEAELKTLSLGKRVIQDGQPRQKNTSVRKSKSRRVSFASSYRAEHGLEHVPGLIVHPRRGQSQECFYSVIVTIGRIRLLTKEHRSLQVVRSFHAALVAVKERMEGVCPAAFEHRFREMLAVCLTEHNLEAETMGLRFCVCLAALWLPRPLVTPPFRAEGDAMDAGLRAWRRLGEARGLVLQRGSVLQVLSPDEIAVVWDRVRAAYLDIVSEVAAREGPQAFKQQEAAMTRLQVLEAAQEKERERQLERWNCRQMAQEEAFQRSCSQRAFHHDSLPKTLKRRRDRLAGQERALQSLDRLLLNWSRNMPRWLRARRLGAATKRGQQS
eukprot:TRINITY_DN17227_c0_g1_i1.p1 TRINITY_DN17227_c0_g1~~TRINITY_DN17227_c0_g1_i1.p1  ORF type:complete len:542 (-),score=86.33 TRINITY_DN17227_c0_g1_i1:301-1926(-)